MAAATSALSQASSSHTSSVNSLVESATAQFAQMVSDVESRGKGVLDNLKSKLETSTQQLGEGLNNVVTSELPGKIDEVAAAEAAKVQPAWKGLVKTIIGVVIAVVVTVAIIALAASGVGLPAAIGLAALIGAAGGLLQTASSDLIDGKMSSWQEYAKSAGVGAATGVLQLVGLRGATSVAGAFTSNAAKQAAAIGVEGSTDVLADLGTRLANGEKLGLETLGISVASSLLSQVGLGKLQGRMSGVAKKMDFPPSAVEAIGKSSKLEFALDTVGEIGTEAIITAASGQEVNLVQIAAGAGAGNATAGRLSRTRTFERASNYRRSPGDSVDVNIDSKLDTDVASDNVDTLPASERRQRNQTPDDEVTSRRGGDESRTQPTRSPVDEPINNRSRTPDEGRNNSARTRDESTTEPRVKQESSS